MNVKINTPEDAKRLAQTITQENENKKEQGKNVILSSFEALNQIMPDAGSFDEIAVLLTLPEDQFTLLGPIFLNELEKSFSNINDQMMMVQLMNAAGIKSEDLELEYEKLCEAIDEQMAEYLSTQKRDFLKRMLSFSYNAVSEADGVGKKKVLIALEYCNQNAKMPKYAHLSDAGMDVYTTEEIVIHPGETKLIPLGIKCALPLGYELQVRPKSGRSLKSKLRIANTPGTIDAGYRDEICIIADNIDPVIRSAEIDENGRLFNVTWGSDIVIDKGEKIAQLVLSEVPKAIFYEVESVNTIAGENRNGGFGSTGEK